MRDGDRRIRRYIFCISIPPYDNRTQHSHEFFLFVFLFPSPLQTLLLNDVKILYSDLYWIIITSQAPTVVRTTRPEEYDKQRKRMVYFLYRTSVPLSKSCQCRYRSLYKPIVLSHMLSYPDIQCVHVLKKEFLVC